MYVRDYGDLPSTWQEGRTRGDLWPVVAFACVALLLAILATIFVPQFAPMMADAVVT